MAADYWLSTHCNHWLLDKPQLALAREEDTKYATMEELGAITIWLSNLVSTLCKRLSLRQRVTATACIFLRRFYIKNSYSSVDPFLPLSSCVYVAAKVEEAPIHIKSVVLESIRVFQEIGCRGFSCDNASLAEMEFYLLEELEFDLVVYHPYRALMGIEMEQHEMQMAWFVLNDTFKMDVGLCFPPHVLAVASVWLGVLLHPPAAERLRKSTKEMQEKREAGESVTPPDDILTYLAGLNVSLAMVEEVVRDILGNYQLEAKVGNMIGDGPGMVKRLERMREDRRRDLVKTSRSNTGIQA